MYVHSQRLSRPKAPQPFMLIFVALHVVSVMPKLAGLVFHVSCVERTVMPSCIFPSQGEALFLSSLSHFLLDKEFNPHGSLGVLAGESNVSIWGGFDSPPTRSFCVFLLMCLSGNFWLEICVSFSCGCWIFVLVASAPSRKRVSRVEAV